MQKQLFSVENKIIIITGGGKGIGGVIAHAMAQRKAVVYCFDIEFEDGIIEELAQNLYQVKVDITKKSSIKKTCEEIFSTHNKIDVLINNAGITNPIDYFETYPIDNWERTLNVNLTGSFICSQVVLEYMKKNKGGSIINITSLNAELAFPNNPAYVASKGGLKMLGKALARDWGKYGIRVNNLGPGYIKTDMTEASFKNKKTMNEREERTILGRWGEVDDLIGPCIFLASDASEYITGQDIYIDGGWLYKGL